MLNIKKISPYIILLLAIIMGAFFLFYGLGEADPVTDEEEIAFRALGYMDFLHTPFQTTPYEWFSPAPWWVSLSFHDHPPLTFLIEHAIFRILNDSTFFIRIPFAFCGLLSIVLLFLIGKKCIHPFAGALAALCASVNNYFIWIHRIGLQEGLVIFLLLLSLYLLMQSKEHPKFFFAWGMSVGLALLTKYTAFILFPISFLHIAFFHRAAWREKKFYSGIIIAIILFLPVIIYNIQLYKGVGHFDVQISSLLHQTTPEWKILAGKNIGSAWTRITQLYPNLWDRASHPFVALWILTVLVFAYYIARSWMKKQGATILLFLLSCTILLHLLVILIGPSERFVSMLIPFMILMMSAIGVQLINQNNLFLRSLAIILVIFFLAYESWFSYKTIFMQKSGTDISHAMSSLTKESYSWGYNQLEKSLAKLLDEKRPSVTLVLPEQWKFIEAFRAKDARKIKKNPSASILIVYDPRINNVAKLWIYDRRYFYDDWPIISIDEYMAAINYSKNFFTKLGIQKYYYIAATENTQTLGNTQDSLEAEKFKNNLVEKKITPIENIYSQDKTKVFEIYLFLQDMQK